MPFSTLLGHFRNVPPVAGARSPEELEALQQRVKELAAGGRYETPLMASGRGAAYIGVNSVTWRLPRHMREVLLVTSRILECDPLDPDAITRAEREGRQQVYEVAGFFKTQVPGFEETYIVSTGNHVGVRSSRRVQGRATVTDQDALTFQKHPHSIARSSWDVDVWPADSYLNPAVDRGTGDHDRRLERMQRGDYFDIPYGCVVAHGVENLLTGGRIVSAGHLAESSLRIQQTCMATGEAAGAAAAFGVRQGIPPSQLDPETVCGHLNETRAKTKPAFALLGQAYERFARGGSIRDL